MSNGSELKSPAAKALREAGFVPLPRLWVTPDQLEVIKRMAEENSDVVNEIRRKANHQHPNSRPNSLCDKIDAASRSDKPSID